MPSRKSDTSVARFVLTDDDHEDSTMTTEPAAAPAPSATDEPSVAGSTQQPSDKKDKEKERDNLTIEDLALPKSIITRLAKGVLPPNTQIQANAILALTKSATVFINHLANAANEITVSSNKKTIMPGDVFKAIDEIEYGFMREKLEAEFAKFNEVQTSKRSTYRRKVAAAKKAATGTGTGEGAAGASQNSTDAGAAADISMMSIGSTTMGGDETERSMLQQQQSPSAGAGVGAWTGAGEQPRLAKKARLDPASMEVDDEDGEGGDGEGGDGEVSDAETVPEEQEEEEEEEDEDVEEEEEEEEEDGEEEGADEDGDELEERAAREEEDEALDDDSD